MHYRRFRTGKTEYDPVEGPRKAVALGYDPEADIAPRVIATAQGALAEKVIAIALANDIPIREDPLLTAALANVRLDDVIPPELFAVVAEVLAYVYRVRQASV